MNAARVGRPWMRARHAVGATTEASRIASGHGYGGNALSPAVVVLSEGPHALTGDSGLSGGTFSDPAQGFGWGWR